MSFSYYPLFSPSASAGTLILHNSVCTWSDTGTLSLDTLAPLTSTIWNLIPCLLFKLPTLGIPLNYTSFHARYPTQMSPGAFQWIWFLQRFGWRKKFRIGAHGATCTPKCQGLGAHTSCIDWQLPKIVLIYFPNSLTGITLKKYH